MNQIVKKYENFILYLKFIGNQQVFLVASVTSNVSNIEDLCMEMYTEIASVMHENKIESLHERIFGSLSLFESVHKIRTNIFKEYSIDSEIPFTFLEGNPYWGKGISGINIHGVILESPTDKVCNIKHDGRVCGRTWENKDSHCLMLHSIHGLKDSSMDYYNQTLEMFGKADDILKENGFEFRNVVRTWVYLQEISKQYDAFNNARNLKFREFGLIPNELDNNLYEQVYMPASTGIECYNTFQASGVMDLFAIKKKQSSNIIIESENGNKQKSAYRYGSAFSRSMIIKDEANKYIYLSGTASINKKGETVYIDDIKNQLEMTGSVIKALIKEEDYDFNDLCEGTVFLKKADYLSDYREYCQKNELWEMPCIITLANVCREDLLFEMDATFSK